MALRKRRPGRAARWGLRLVFAALAAGGAAGLMVAGGFAYTEHARAGRESRTPEQIAGSRGRWVHAADTELFIQEWGDAQRPTVLLIHGTGAWSGTWFELPQALSAAGWHVVAVDLPPFGLSKPGGAANRVDYTRRAQADRILGLVDALGAPVTLIGHSFGAGPALEAAMRAGGRLRQLVLVDPALGLGDDGSAAQCSAGSGSGWLAQARGVRTSLVGATATSPALTTTLLKRFVHRKDVVTDALASAYQIPFERRDFSATLGDWALAFAGSACESAASLSPDSLRTWARAAPPVALIWGEQDTITPIVQARALQAWMPTATLTVLPAVGHIPHIEAPAEFATALKGVLQFNAPRP